MKLSTLPSRILWIALYLFWGFAFQFQPIKAEWVYSCQGSEVFPNGFALPFFYKTSSLASSMAYHYYLLGMILNSLVLAGIFWIFNFLFKKIVVLNFKSVKLALGLLLIIYFSFFMFLELSNAGNTFTWIPDEKDVMAGENWGLTCKTSFVWFSQRN